MGKEYYYLEEKEQKGPFKIEHFKNVELKPETLVWSEGFDNWVQVKEVDELKEFIKKIPPPPPIIDNSPNTSETEKDSIDEEKILVQDSNLKFWASFKIYFFSLLLIGLAIIVSFVITNRKKQTLKNEIYSKIENILDGKTVVLDGTHSLTQGELEETGYNSKSKSDDFFAPWWKREKLYTIYKASYGGFTIKQLTKQYQDGYDIKTYSSGDMGYKKSTRRYVKPEYMDWGYGEKKKVSGGYYTDNYRLSVRECYRSAFDYFTTEDRESSGAYTAGKLVDITNFPDMRNEFYYIINSEPKQYTSSGQFLSNWYTSDEHGANINTDDWAVYYKTSGKHYVLTENEKAINKMLYTYLGISVGSIIILLLIFGLSKPKYFRNLKLYGKRWKNTSYNEQIFFFEHSFLGKHTFIEIHNEKVLRGVLKFTDKGNTINLSYPNKELFYKIEQINSDSLTLNSMKDKFEVSFVRIGAKVKKEENEKNIETSLDEPNVEKENNDI